MNVTHECIFCHRTKTGRFIKSSISTGWSQKLAGGMNWSCYDCTPDKLEGVTVPKATAAPSPTVSTLTPVVKARVQKEGAQLLAPIQSEVQGLIIKTEDDYLSADAILGRIVEVRKRWTAKLAPILDPLARVLKEAKAAQAGAKALFDEADKPMGVLEESVRGKMRNFKLEEAHMLREQREEQDRVNRAITQAAEREAQARTAPQRAKAIIQREGLEQMAETLAVEAVTAVSATNSGTRTRENWRVGDMTMFLRAIADGELDLDCILLNMPKLNRQWRDDAQGMKSWPGIETFDDVTIVRK